MSDVTDDFLAHYGVVGMKWGKHGSKKEFKGAKKAIRKEMYKSAGASIKANKGKTVAAALLIGATQTAGFTMARAAGHSKGKSAVIGLLGGAPGGMLAINIAAKKAAREG
jgi:hypothetical protein